MWGYIPRGLSPRGPYLLNWDPVVVVSRMNGPRTKCKGEVIREILFPPAAFVACPPFWLF
jgi:hypothetical protein